MKTKSTVMFVIASMLVVALYACVFPDGDDKKYANASVNLGYVAKAVDGYVRYGNPPTDQSGEALLQEATKINPDLLPPLADYLVMAKREGQLSAVLLCTADGKRGLAEDAGCTASKLDGPYWQDSEFVACSFQLDLIRACGN